MEGHATAPGRVSKFTNKLNSTRWKEIFVFTEIPKSINTLRIKLAGIASPISINTRLKEEI